MNTFFNKLEYKFGNYAIKNLNMYLAVIYLVGLMIQTLNPSFYALYLSLNIYAFVHGQIYRFFTFIFYPPAYSVSTLLSLLGIWVYYSLSKSLLYVWSDFKFNMYILCGMIGHLIGGLIIYFIFGQQYIIMSPTFLAFSIFIAYAFTFPDSVFLLFFILPVKAKYLGYFEIILYLLYFITGDINSKIAIVCSLINVYIFIYATYKFDIIISIKKFINKFKK